MHSLLKACAEHAADGARPVRGRALFTLALPLALALVLALAAAGCGGDGDAAASTSSETGASSTSPGTSPTPTSTLDPERSPSSATPSSSSRTSESTASESLPSTAPVSERELRFSPEGDPALELVIETNPFALGLWRDGVRLAALANEPASARSGLALGRALAWRANRYYDPKLAQRGGEGPLQKEWFVAVSVIGADVASGPPILILRTEDAEGVRGPDLELRIEESGRSLGVEVRAPEEPEHVFIVANFEAPDGEGYYGFGELFDRIDSRGIVREMLIQAEGSSESGTNEVHVPVPFFMGTLGWGLFVDDRHPIAFDVAATREDLLRAAINHHVMPLWFMADPEPLALVREFTRLTAQPAHVPFWSLGPVFWRNRYAGQEQVLSDVRRAREEGMGGSLMWIDRPWQSYYQNFRFNPAQYPDPEEMYEEIRALGYRTLLHHSPQMNPPGQGTIQGGEDASEGLYELFLENGWLVTQQPGGSPFIFPWGGGRGAFIDWSHPDAVAHVQGMIPRVADLGVVGVKMDWDEFLQPNVGSLRVRLNFHNGETNLTMKSWYSALYHKAVIEGFEAALGEPGFTLVRHASPRNQPWATCVWPGDLDNDFTEHTRGPSEMQDDWNVGGLPAAIVGQLSLALSGFPCFASDIGGFRNGQPAEDALLRWMAFGVFNGVMQLGGGGSTHMPWSEDTPYSAEALDITRDFFQLRMDLFPYIFQQFREAEQDGTPIARPMWMMHPAEPAARAFDRDFYFGPDIIVAPVWEEGATDRTLWLPPGSWVDLYSGELLEGGVERTRDVPMDEIAVHLRAGALIPLLAEDVISLLPTEDPELVAYQDRAENRLWVVPGGEATLRLFNGLEADLAELAGEGAPGVEVTLGIGTPDPEIDERIRFAPERVTLRVERVGTSFATSAPEVTLGGAPLAEIDPADDDDTGWWLAGEDERWVKVRTEGTGVVTLR